MTRRSRGIDRLARNANSIPLKLSHTDSIRKPASLSAFTAAWARSASTRAARELWERAIGTNRQSPPMSGADGAARLEQSLVVDRDKSCCPKTDQWRRTCGPDGPSHWTSRLPLVKVRCQHPNRIIRRAPAGGFKDDIDIHRSGRLRCRSGRVYGPAALRRSGKQLWTIAESLDA